MIPTDIGVNPDMPEPLPVEPKPAEETDQLERSLLPRVNSEEANELARTIETDYQAALADREPWESRLAEWEDQYYGVLPPKDFPWPGAANFHVPITMMGVETYKPRLIEAILGNDPPVQVAPVDTADEQRRDRAELFLNWQLNNEIDNLAEIVAESAHVFMIPGTVVAKVTWKVDRRRKMFVREFPQGTAVEVILRSLFGHRLPRDIEQVGDLEWTGEADVGPKSGPPLEVRLKLKFLEDGTIQARVEQEDIRERPDIALIDPPDFITPAKAGSDIQAMPWVQQRLWMSEQDLRAQVYQGVFDKQAVEDLLNGVPPAGDFDLKDATAYRESKAVTEGVEDQGASDARASQYAVLEDHRRYDVRGDGEVLDIITWYCPDLPGRILGWDVLDNVYAHGRRPFRAGRFSTIPFRFLGYCYAEMIRGIQDELNTIHNQRVDQGTITNLPFFFYRASSAVPASMTRVQPGQGIPVDQPLQDVQFPKWGGNLAWGQQEEALLMQYKERLDGLTDISMGRQPTRVGATRTAAGTATLLQESGLRQKTALEAFQRFWLGIFEDILALDQEYLPPGKEFRVTGRVPELIRLKDRTEIAGRFDLRLVAASQTMNRAAAREDSQIVLQGLLNPAFLGGGLVGLKGVTKALSEFLKAYGRDPDAYLEIHGAPKSPEEELALILSGQQVRAIAGFDPTAHMEKHQEQLRDPLIRAVLRPEGVANLQKLMQEEMMLGQAMQMAQMLQGAKGKPGEAAQGQDAVEAQKGANAPQPAQPGQKTSLPPGGKGAE